METTYQNKLGSEEIVQSSYSYNSNDASSASKTTTPSPPIFADFQGAYRHVEGCTTRSPRVGTISETWTVPAHVLHDNYTLSEPPPPYLEAVSNYYSPQQHMNAFVVDVINVDNSRTKTTRTNRQGAPITDPPCTIKKEYLKSKLAFLKIFEFIVCLTGFSTCLSFQSSFDLSLTSSDKSTFFVISLVASCVFSLIIFWLNFIGFLENCDTKSSLFKMAITHGQFTLLLLVASTLLATMQICSGQYIAECQIYHTAMACGFIAASIFLADTVIQCISYRVKAN